MEAGLAVAMMPALDLRSDSSTDAHCTSPGFEDSPASGLQNCDLKYQYCPSL